jgi:cephalosporin-C deacetylase-like acetyl esterase
MDVLRTMRNYPKIAVILRNNFDAKTMYCYEDYFPDNKSLLELLISLPVST